MQHPLARIEPRLLGALTVRLGALVVFSTALMMFIDVPLQVGSAPFGIVSFELAGTPQRALRILLEWKSEGVLGFARLSLIADFLYLVVYALFFATLALWVGERLQERTWSARAAWAATVAAVFDVLENGVLLFEVTRFTSPAPYPQLATGLALAKFVLLALSGLYGVIGGIVAFARVQRRPL